MCKKVFFFNHLSIFLGLFQNGVFLEKHFTWNFFSDSGNSVHGDSNDTCARRTDRNSWRNTSSNINTSSKVSDQCISALPSQAILFLEKSCRAELIDKFREIVSYHFVMMLEVSVFGSGPSLQTLDHHCRNQIRISGCCCCCCCCCGCCSCNTWDEWTGRGLNRLS